MKGDESSFSGDKASFQLQGDKALIRMENLVTLSTRQLVTKRTLSTRNS